MVLELAQDRHKKEQWLEKVLVYLVSTLVRLMALVLEQLLDKVWAFQANRLDLLMVQGLVGLLHKLEH